MLTTEQLHDIQARMTAARARVSDGQGEELGNQVISVVEDAESLLVQIELLEKDKEKCERYAQDFYQAATRYQTSWNQLSESVKRYFESPGVAVPNEAYREVAQLLGLPIWDGD